MDHIPLALQIAVVVVGFIVSGGTITFSILSHLTASRALKLSEASIKLNEESQKFAHEERSAALRNNLMNKRGEVYWEVIEAIWEASQALDKVAVTKQLQIQGVEELTVISDAASAKVGFAIHKTTVFGSENCMYLSTLWLSNYATRTSLIGRRHYLACLDDDRLADAKMQDTFGKLMMEVRNDLGIVTIEKDVGALLQTMGAKPVKIAWEGNSPEAVG